MPKCRQDAGGQLCKMRRMTKSALDEIDRRLLAELRADGRLTHVALAARVGLSRSAVQERVGRLERAGIIRGYTVRLADPAPNQGLRAYLLVRGGASHERAVKVLQGFPEVTVADSVSGDIDLVLQLQADRIEDINRIRDEVAKLPGIASTQTLLVMAARFDRR
jgi:Lrp/AsnC family leucine-responsive transcriptional regulator